jgi:hypothetical protein
LVFSFYLSTFLPHKKDTDLKKVGKPNFLLFYRRTSIPEKIFSGGIKKVTMSTTRLILSKIQNANGDYMEYNDMGVVPTNIIGFSADAKLGVFVREETGQNVMKNHIFVSADVVIKLCTPPSTQKLFGGMVHLQNCFYSEMLSKNMTAWLAYVNRVSIASHVNQYVQ